MNNNQKINSEATIDEKVAKTNPLDSSHEYHNVDEIARDLGVESDCGKELSMSERLRLRDEAR